MECRTKLEGNTLNKQTIEQVVGDAEHVIIIGVTDGVADLAFTDSLDEMELLDIMTFITARLYETTEEPKKH